MGEVFQESLHDLESEDYLESVLQRLGVDRSKLPRNPSIEDAGNEAIFSQMMTVYARRLIKAHTELVQTIRKERIPSWVIWQELNARTKTLPNAEGGNITDTMSASFGLYADLINVDKRIAELIQQGSRKNNLLLELHRKIPEKRGLKGLVASLKT